VPNKWANDPAMNKKAEMTLIDTPVFLVGSERSGTTLLRLMLDHHPKIAFNLESEYIVTQISDDGVYPEIVRYREWLKNDRVFQHSHFEIDERLDYTELVNDFLNQKKTRDNKQIVGATIHFHFHKLAQIWPSAKYIYLYRDGRDVASSVVRMGWAGNVYVAADWWLKAEQEWDEVRQALDSDNWIEIRYEDLIAKTELELERICTFIGVERSRAMLDYVQNSTYQSPDPSLSYQWKTTMRKVDVQRLEEKLGDRLSSRGYELSGLPRISISGLEKSLLRLHSRLRAYLDRLRRYGAVLTFQETLSRRFGLDQAHRNAVRKIDSIIDANLK
jgi:hypothetical protein